MQTIAKPASMKVGTPVSNALFLLHKTILKSISAIKELKKIGKTQTESSFNVSANTT
jgi:hypothetical protein